MPVRWCLCWTKDLYVCAFYFFCVFLYIYIWSESFQFQKLNFLLECHKMTSLHLQRLHFSIHDTISFTTSVKFTPFEKHKYCISVCFEVLYIFWSFIISVLITLYHMTPAPYMNAKISTNADTTSLIELW